AVPAAAGSPAAPPRRAEAPGFRCEGKTYCRQMGSCEEARFYLANCPGTKMDGDHDGIPCEDQFCGH
ncbi:MAG: excalibur calcium-binding domain-containing protein, partial [Solimonas sp.]